jgi:hypothetical protein
MLKKRQTPDLETGHGFSEWVSVSRACLRTDRWQLVHRAGGVGEFDVLADASRQPDGCCKTARPVKGVDGVDETWRCCLMDK